MQILSTHGGTNTVGLTFNTKKIFGEVVKELDKEVDGVETLKAERAWDCLRVEGKWGKNVSLFLVFF